MTLDAFVGFAVLGLAFAAANWFWRDSGQRLVAEWCVSNAVYPEAHTFEFTMGRPASASIVGRQNGVRYLFRFTLHSSFLRGFSAWSRVVLRERAPID